MKYQGTAKVSVCVPVFNNRSTIKETIVSLLAQTYENLEILVVDNASTDGTDLLLKSFVDDRLKVFTFTDHLSMEQNVERSIRLASGDYIAVYHGDDVYTPDIVSKEVAYLERNVNAAAVFTLGISIDMNGKSLGNYPNPPELEDPANYGKTFYFMEIFRLILRDHNFLICPTAMVRRETYLNLNTRWTSEKFKSSADLGVWLGILERAPIGVIPERLIYNRHSGRERYSEKVRFLNKNKADFFLVIEDYLSRPEIAGGLMPEDLANHDFLVFQDNVLRGFNSIISGDYSRAREMLRLNPMKLSNFAKIDKATYRKVMKWCAYCIIGKVVLGSPLKIWFGYFLRKKLYTYL